MRIDLPPALQDAQALLRLLGAAVSAECLPPIRGIATDSREVRLGDLFVALDGVHTSGECFLHKAHQAGAVAALVKGEIASTELPLLCVEDPIAALLRAAGEYRARSDAFVVAVSGSMGKTTVKEALAAVLREDGTVEWSKGNFNSQIGMPLSLLSMREAKYWVLEIGINHVGEMEALACAAAPDLAILTNVGTAHIGNFGSFDAVLREKARIAVALQENGYLLIPSALPTEVFPCPRHAIWRMGEGGEYRLENIRYSECGTVGDLITPDQVITNLVWPIAGGAGAATLETVGAAALLAGLDEQKIRSGLLAAGKRTPRLARIEAGGRLLIDDCYNASPEAMLVALENLGLISGGRPTVAVLGDMLELGKYSDMLHRSVGRGVARSGISQLFTYGRAAMGIVEGARAAGLDDKAIHAFDVGEDEALINALCRMLPKDAAVLFKASGGMHLCRVLHEVRRRLR